MENKKIIVFEKDQKARHIIDIMARKMGAVELTEVDTQQQFDLTLSASVDRTSGMSGLLGKAALPKLKVDLFIIDWGSPDGGALKLIRTIKASYAGNYRFLLVADKQHVTDMGAALKAGATDLLLKPFTMADFKEKMDNVLSEKPLTVTSFNLSAPVEKAKKAGTGVVNPFSFGKDAPKPDASAPQKEVAPSPFARPAMPPPPVNITPKMAPPPGADARKSGGGPSFHAAATGKTKKWADKPTATLIDGKINGHYHEKVDIIGGGENCYWAVEQPDDTVRLEYLSAKGTATGMEAKIIDRDEFLHTFYLCQEYGCHLLQRLGQWPPPGHTTK